MGYELVQTDTSLLVLVKFQTEKSSVRHGNKKAQRSNKLTE